MWDYPFGVAGSRMQAATEVEAVEMAKAFIDAGGKRDHARSETPRDGDADSA
jgi:hypothetical protein